ncbi:hypothetical protein J1N35_008777 [Gossypium stocksii]|uniref:RNase H type-1 domain-containing protein n=1 Tax=Gossypium stocksii TaxID=47602 RepID=A0A9D3W8T5_9ROSI|nr:hypothetical protein J1N35_008777 [Gossypium stocksii]
MNQNSEKKTISLFSIEKTNRCWCEEEELVLSIFFLIKLLISIRSSHELTASALDWAKSFGFSGNMKQLAYFSKTEQGWQCPKPGWIKINIDGLVSMSKTKVAIGGVLRYSSGVWLVGFEMVTEVSSILQIEAQAIVEGLKLVWSKGIK